MFSLPSMVTTPNVELESSVLVVLCFFDGAPPSLVFFELEARVVFVVLLADGIITLALI